MSQPEPLAEEGKDASAHPITDLEPGAEISHGSVTGKVVGTFTGTMVLVALPDGTEVGVLP